MSEDFDSKRLQDTPDDPTRREWLLRLGELVALAGVSGIVPEFATFAAAQEATAAALPPGLYDASQDHFVHALSSGSSKWNPPAGSETEYAAHIPAPYRPQFFSAEDFPEVKRVMEILLGDVDAAALEQAVQWFDSWLFSAGGVRTAARQLDPMHRILAVAYYGEESVRELETADPQAVARVGLQALRDESEKRYGRGFLQLSAAEQVGLVSSARSSSPGTGIHKFVDVARTEAIRGYYTSAAGLKELDYKGNAYYGESPGCEGKMG